MRRIALIMIVLASCVCWLPGVSRAQTSTVISSLTVTAALQTNGQVQITQEIRYPQPSELAWTLFTNIQHLGITGGGVALKSNEWQTSGPANQTLLTTTPVASDWLIRYQTTTTLIRQQNIDQVYLKVFQQSGDQISHISVTFSLPKSVPSGSLTGNVYSISGSLNPATAPVSAQVIRYSADFAGPQALFTISASWPKSVLNLSPSQELRLDLLNLNAWPWILLGLVLPGITLIVLLVLLSLKRLSEQSVSRIASQPPSALSPILVGVLVNKKIYPEEIVSLLVDLCQRGYLVIVKKSGQYSLSQRRQPDDQLQPWEQEVIRQLFPAPGAVLSETTVGTLSSQALFSPAVRDAFDRIYQVSTDAEFFMENPHQTRVRYKLVALFFYFVALFGIIWTAFSADSPYLLIPLVGTLALAYLIIRLSPQLTRYTARGLQTREAWLAFANFLAEPKPLGLTESQNHVFEKYLAYAIALHQTVTWANRFERSSTEIIQPDWLISYAELDVKDLSKELLQFTEQIGRQITKLRGPLVN